MPFRISLVRAATSPGHSDPRRVGPADGIAFSGSATGATASILVDVGGNGIAGGSPAEPRRDGRQPTPTRAAGTTRRFPTASKETGKFYVIAGDEAHPVNPRNPGLIIACATSERRRRRCGWFHLHRLRPTWRTSRRRWRATSVPEAGHAQPLGRLGAGRCIYGAYYNGGAAGGRHLGRARSGDLYRQGREIAKFYSDDSQGFVPNSPFVWGPQPHKGTIFFSDFHSGLWAVRLVSNDDTQETMP